MVEYNRFTGNPPTNTSAVQAFTNEMGFAPREMDSELSQISTLQEQLTTAQGQVTTLQGQVTTLRAQVTGLGGTPSA